MGYALVPISRCLINCIVVFYLTYFWYSAVAHATSSPLRKYQAIIDEGGRRRQGFSSNSLEQSLLESKGILSALKGTDIRGTIGNVLTGVIDAAAPGACAGALLSTGYTNSLYDEDDYPFQPSCSKPNTENSISCFPSSAKVMTPEGLLPMSEISIGTNIATGIETSKDKEQSYIFHPVLFFLHKNPEAPLEPWIKLEWKLVLENFTTSATSQKMSTFLSPNHLVFTCQESANVKNNDCGYLAARRVKIGNIVTIPKQTQSGEARQKSKIINVIHVSPSEAPEHQIKGLYAPATAAGVLYVDGLLVSQYSTLPTLPYNWDNAVHYIVHRLLKPVFWFTEIHPPSLGYMMNYGLDGSRYLGKIIISIINLSKTSQEKALEPACQKFQSFQFFSLIKS